MRKVKLVFTKTVEVECELEQQDIDKILYLGPPGWVFEEADVIDNEKPLEFDYWEDIKDE